MEKICIAPGEHGQFKNWGEDPFLEEKMFPHLFPYGVGGYMSTSVSGDNENMGFSNYVRHRILNADPRYRSDTTYLFFLLIVKELIDLKRSKETYLRKAQTMPHMKLSDFQEISSYANLARSNTGFEVFKSIRGTSPYYQQAKKNLMAILRQKGCPSLFLTMSCAEYKWDTLIQEILQVKERRTVKIEEVEAMSSSDKNKLLIENPVISTLHFNKRMEKMFQYFKTNDAFSPYKMDDYFFRIEFQARGSPHIHSLIYLQEEYVDESGEKKWRPVKTMFQETDNDEERNEKISNIEKCAKILLSASVTDVYCENCEKDNVSKHETDSTCEECQILRDRVQSNNTHKCGFSCHKRKKQMTIKPNEGHGGLNGKI